MEYDAAGRLVAVKTDAGVVVASYTYGDSNARLVTHEGGSRTYYLWGGPGVVAEYSETDGTASANSPQWSKSYVYLGGRLLATEQPNGAAEYVEYHHPDRLGTRVVTNSQNTNSYEQAALPYGAALDGESTGATQRRFTSYDRSFSTGLDYAVNRQYDPLQGRFTTVDPIEMDAVDLSDPQTLNLYAYCINDPVNHIDPDGLFLGKLFGWIGKAVKWVLTAVAVVVAVIGVLAVSSVLSPAVGVAFGLKMFALAGALLGAAHGPAWLQRAIGTASQFGRLSRGFGIGGTSVFNPNAGSGLGGGVGSVNGYIFRLQQDDEAIDFGDIVRININICANGNRYPHCGAGWGGLIPVVGPAWNAHDAFRSGRWGWGLFYTAEAISDVFIVKALATSAIKGAAKLGARAIQSVSTKLSRRGGVGIGSSKYVRIVAKSNPSETSVGVIIGKRRVLDIGRAEVVRGRGKQLHIRLGPNGAHRTWYGKRIK